MNQGTRLLVFCACFYCFATVVHFTHNAEYLADYPNMPKWITRGGVYFVWASEALIGVLGVAFLYFGFRRTGILLLMVYALLGFDGLLHYTLAPFQAHSLAMNVTILFEVAAAAILLLVAALKLRR
jgi:hypothetical protein